MVNDGNDDGGRQRCLSTSNASDEREYDHGHVHLHEEHSRVRAVRKSLAMSKASGLIRSALE